MSNKNLIKLIEKELTIKSKKQTKYITTEFNKSYTEIKKYIENKFSEECKIFKEEIDCISTFLSSNSILEEFKLLSLQIDQSIKKYELVLTKVEDLNNKVVRFTKIREKLRKDVMKKLEEDSDSIKKEVNKLNI
ncbi:hypothetical protein P3W45_000239 [Vairimorpha bombi]|jgi:hypothetical protein